MTRALAMIAPLMMGCSALAQPPVPSLSPVKEAATPVQEDIDEEVSETLSSLAPDQPAIVEDAEVGNFTELTGSLRQGGLIMGRTTAGTTIKLVTYGANENITDSRDVDVDPEGNFLFGFDRDHGEQAVLMVSYPNAENAEPKTLPVAPYPWRESSITVQESKANPYKPEDLEQIAEERDIKNKARATRSTEAMWIGGFAWPTTGCVSSEFGSRRIVNGTPRRFHSGVDVAAPDGMSPMDYIGNEVVAPADGVIRLAEKDMFFEGGMVFIDHGQKLESALMHMSSVDVEVGQIVKQGDKVGEVGMSGRVTGPHLHWSLKWQDRLLDPTTVVDAKAKCTD